jgi:hypothetical protein
MKSLGAVGPSCSATDPAPRILCLTRRSRSQTGKLDRSGIAFEPREHRGKWRSSKISWQGMAQSNSKGTKDGRPYRDLGESYLGRLHRNRSRATCSAFPEHSVIRLSPRRLTMIRTAPTQTLHRASRAFQTRSATDFFFVARTPSAISLPRIVKCYQIKHFLDFGRNFS